MNVGGAPSSASNSAMVLHGTCREVFHIPTRFGVRLAFGWHFNSLCSTASMRFVPASRHLRVRSLSTAESYGTPEGHGVGAQHDAE